MHTIDTEKLDSGDTPGIDDREARKRARDNSAGDGRPTSQGTRPDPTRYGDWERGGRCIDF